MTATTEEHRTVSTLRAVSNVAVWIIALAMAVLAVGQGVGSVVSWRSGEVTSSVDKRADILVEAVLEQTVGSCERQEALVRMQANVSALRRYLISAQIPPAIPQDRADVIEELRKLEAEDLELQRQQAAGLSITSCPTVEQLRRRAEAERDKGTDLDIVPPTTTEGN